MLVRHAYGLFALALLGCCTAALAAPPAYVPLEARLTPEQLQTTGLDGLTPTQLAALNAILAGEAAARPATEPRDQDSTSRRDPVTGRIVGRFTGWTSGTSFTLDTGSRWQVTEGSYDARAVDSPKATVKPGLISGWYLYVEGQPVVAKVRRLP